MPHRKTIVSSVYGGWTKRGWIDYALAVPPVRTTPTRSRSPPVPQSRHHAHASRIIIIVSPASYFKNSASCQEDVVVGVVVLEL